jgi:hypothetical protein
MKLLLLLAMIFSNVVYASVWKDTQDWSLQYEDEFSNWMASSQVHQKIFSDHSSPYYGISSDCADTAYALRAIFAYEHSLPFVINNPSGSRNGKKISNRLSSWDSAGSPIKRLVAFINEVGESVGTDNLTRLDTFPVALNAIRSGSIFTVSARTKLGKEIHHTYNIKAINPIGTFDVIYGTQAGQASKLPLTRRPDRELENLPHDPWGFRKFRWPEHLNQDLSVIPKELGPSMEQFTLAEKLGQLQFFKYLKKIIATDAELPESRMSRNFKTLCAESQARIEYVNQGLNYLQKINNRCMNFTEFDTYSTPARDDALIDLFVKTQTAFMEIKSDGNLDKVDPKWIEFSEIIFNKEILSPDRLLAFCPLNYRPGVTIDLATLWSRADSDKLSSHPNDLVELRWGEQTTPATKCDRWY